jgi:hypothetical protein
MVILLGAGSPSFAQTNLLANPGFEDAGGSYNGWFSFGSGPNISTPADDNIMRTGVAAAKIYGEFNCISYEPVGGFGQAFTPTAGKVYEFGGYSYVSSTDAMFGTDTCNKNRAIAQVAFFNASSGGAVVARNEVVIGDGNFPLDQWFEFSVSIPAPDNALRVEALVLFLQPACDTGSVFIDDTWLYELTPTAEPNFVVNPSFDDGLKYWNTFGNAFPEGRTFGFRTPSGSAKLFGPFANPGDASGMFQTFSATEGSTWFFDIYALNTCTEDPISGTNDNYASIKLVFEDEFGAELIATEAVIVDNTTSPGKWTKHTVSATAPAGVRFVSAYVLFIQPSGLGGAVFVDDASVRYSTVSGVADEPAPRAYTLHQNVPNPFNPTTTIRFTMEAEAHVQLGVYDVSGRLVRTLVDGIKTVGDHVVEWNGMDNSGRAVHSGVYFYQIKALGISEVRKMTLLK